jgi:hypothetical protein
MASRVGKGGLRAIPSRRNRLTRSERLLKKEAPYQESRPSQGKDQRTPDRPNHVAEPIVYSSAHSATNAFLSFLLPVSLSHHMKEIMVACFYQPFFFEQEREIRDP